MGDNLHIPRPQSVTTNDSTAAFDRCTMGRPGEFFIVADEGCKGGDCPKIFMREDDENFYIQGYKLSEADSAKLSTPNGEQIVRIPKSLLAALKEL